MKRRIAVWLLLFGLIAGTAAAAPRAKSTWVMMLSGQGKDDTVPWDFFCTGGRNSGVWTKIPVPSCWELQGFGTYDYGLWHRDEKGKPPRPPLSDEQGRYRREFTPPAEWQGRVVKLIFEGVLTDADVRVNGQPAGPVHQGGFYRFSYDITSLVKIGASNRLEVTVSKLSANESVNHAERMGDYWNFGGIFRPVWLEALPAQFIDRVAIDARADGQISADVYLGGKLDDPARLAGQIENMDGAPVGAPFVADVPAGAAQATLRTRLDGVKTWSAETPNLYRVRFTLTPKSGVVYATARRFGFRTFEVRPHDGLYLNGQKITLKGVDRHSFWPESGRTLSRQVCTDDARLIKEMNMNAVRMSHYPPDPEFLEACDTLGLYVLDELAGWQGFYDQPTGARLVGEMIRRDVNHPSILFWDNGNEGGWNTAVDVEFAKWDPQQRPVLHPWENFSHVNTTHYKDFARATQLCAGPDIYMPTEFNHGLYDGGGGAGLRDRWDLMRKSPLCAGGFIWALLDEGVVRTDENGRIDCSGNLAPDGMVGPHREKEGSFNTIRELWSPVAITGPDELPENFDGVLPVENRYDFTNLNQCRFSWTLVRCTGPASAAAPDWVVAAGESDGPAVAPHAEGAVKLDLPDTWRKADLLVVTAKAPSGQDLWTWSWAVQKSPRDVLGANPAGPAGQVREANGELVIAAGATELHLSRATGFLMSVFQKGRAVSLSAGPRFVAYRSKSRDFENIAEAGKLTGLTAHVDSEGNVIAEATFTGPLSDVRWQVSRQDEVTLDYTYAFNGTVDLLGVQFDYPEANMKSIRWLGWGPYRVWKNRMQGTRLDIWENAYNNTTPGESWVYPEFKGYLRGWRWARFETSEGSLFAANGGTGGFLGVYTPNDGKVGPVLNLPATGLAFFDVIPPIGSKFTLANVLGPESQSSQVNGVHHGTIRLRFEVP